MVFTSCVVNPPFIWKVQLGIFYKIQRLSGMSAEKYSSESRALILETRPSSEFNLLLNLICTFKALAVLPTQTAFDVKNGFSH